MQLHTLKTNNTSLKKNRIGRGGKRGSFSGRGIKGQKARAGRRIRPEIRDMIMKIPKHRGHRYTGPAKMRVAVSSLILAKHFKAGERITPKILYEKRLIKKIGGKIPTVKILGSLEPLAGRHIIGLESSKRHIKAQ